MSKHLQPLVQQESEQWRLPKNWEWRRLEDVARLLKPGKLYDESSVSDVGNVPVVNQSEKSFHGFHDDEPGVRASPESPVFTFANHTCHMRLMKQPYSCIQNIFSRIGVPGVSNTIYLYYASLGRVNLAGYKGHHPIYRKQWIPLPPLLEQMRIASILSAYDDLIENNRRRIALLEQAARLLYREWFVHLRFPGHEHTKIIDGVPEGWEKKTVFDVMDVLSGGTPKTSNPSYWGGDIPFFTPRDAGDYAYSYDTEKSITEAGLNSCNSKLYPKDTVFITARGTVGKINLAQRPMAMNQSCYALLAHPPLNQHFLYFALADGVEHFRSRAVGAIFDAIIRDTFKMIPFILPEEKLITAFIEHVSPMLSQIDNLSSQVRSLREARDLLLPKLMSGEVAV